MKKSSEPEHGEPFVISDAVNAVEKKKKKKQQQDESGGHF